VPIAAGLVSGVPRQGRVGVGFATVYGVDEQVPAATPSLTIHDLDAVLTEIQHAKGSGSGTKRMALLADLLRRATAPEADFVKRLVTGELRQGALTALAAEAVARAAGVAPE